MSDWAWIGMICIAFMAGCWAGHGAGFDHGARSVLEALRRRDTSGAEG